MENSSLTPFGKTIKKQLIDIGQSQTWLIDQVSKRTGLYFDRSYMHKILTGKLENPKIIQAIRQILNIPEERKTS